MGKRLAELNASFVGQYPDRTGTGVTFECPVHGPACGGFWVPFENPLDGGPATPNGKGCAWKRTGDTLETLSLTPSTDGSAYSHNGTPCWHGHITNGECT